MAGIMKELPSFQARRNHRDACQQLGWWVNPGGGAVRARADGRGRLVEVVVAPALRATEEIGPLVTEAVRDAQEKHPLLPRTNLAELLSELNLPHPPRNPSWVVGWCLLSAGGPPTLEALVDRLGQLGDRPS